MGRYNRNSAKCHLRPLSLSVLLTGLATTGATSAANLTVNSSADEIASDGVCTLREAIINANNNDQSASSDCVAGEAMPTLDVIVFDESTDNTPIILTQTGTNENAAATGDLDITESVIISGNGADSITEIDGNETDRVFEIRNDAEAQLLNLAVTNGGNVTAGAGIHVFSGRLDMQDAAVFSNTLSGSSGTLEGAGIRTLDVLFLTRVRVTGNQIQASGSANGLGAGISVNTGGFLRLTAGLIEDNIIETVDGTAAGAGIYNNPANVAITTGITGTIFSGNQAIASGEAAADGGAINHQSGDMGISRGTFLNNLAKKTSGMGTSSASGGAIRAFSQPVTIRESTFSGNRVESVDSSTGGAIALNGTGDLYNVTITDNHVTASAGSSAVGGGLRGNVSVSLYNTIVAGNTSNDDSPDCSGSTISSGGYNLIGSNSGCGFVASTGDLVGDVSGGGAAIDPMLAPLADNSGDASFGAFGVPPLTHALLAGSPAIDAGDPNVPGVGGTCGSIDQRGIGRPIDGDGDGGAVCDIGALEFWDEIDSGSGGGSGGGSDSESGSSSSGGSGGGGALSPFLMLAGLLVAVRRRFSRAHT